MKTLSATDHKCLSLPMVTINSIENTKSLLPGDPEKVNSNWKVKEQSNLEKLSTPILSTESSKTTKTKEQRLEKHTTEYPRTVEKLQKV